MNAEDGDSSTRGSFTVYAVVVPSALKQPMAMSSKAALPDWLPCTRPSWFPFVT